jgi:hypothetical protein
MMTNIAQVCFAERLNSIAIGHKAQSAPTNDGRANLPVCLNLTLGKRSDAGGTFLGYAHRNIAPLVLVEVWAAQQHRPILVEPDIRTGQFDTVLDRGSGKSPEPADRNVCAT